MRTLAPLGWPPKPELPAGAAVPGSMAPRSAVASGTAPVAVAAGPLVAVDPPPHAARVKAITRGSIRRMASSPSAG